MLCRDNMFRQNQQVEEVETNTPGTSRERHEESTIEPQNRCSVIVLPSVPSKKQKPLVLSNRFGAPMQVKAFHKGIFKIIAEDMQPLSIVENTGFQSLVELLDSRYEIPSRRTHGRSIIPDIYLTVQNKIQLILNLTKHVAITTDIWTSINTDSYLTITTHFLNHTQFETFVLCAKKLKCSHTGLYLSQVITEELKKWNIYEKVIAVVTDGGANIKSAVRLMNLSHIPCTTHKLNLVVQQSIKCNDDEEIGPEDNTNEGNLRTILKKCRNIVGIFKRSEEGKRLLDEKQKQLEVPQYGS